MMASVLSCICQNRIFVADDLLVPFDLVWCFKTEFTEKLFLILLLFTTILRVDSGWYLQLSTYSSISSMICSIIAAILNSPYSISSNRGIFSFTALVISTQNLLMSPSSSYFLHDGGTEVRIFQAGRQKHGVNIRFQNPVRLCHLQFIFKVCDRAEPADDRMCMILRAKFTEKDRWNAGTGDIWNVFCCLLVY